MSEPGSEVPTAAGSEGFAGFEPEPLGRVLEAFARAHDRQASGLSARDRLVRREALARELAALGLEVELDRLRTLRQLVGLVVPLLERKPSAHH